jgi:hypothetical protein
VSVKVFFLYYESIKWRLPEFIIRGKARTKESTCFDGHTGGTSLVQTLKTPKDLSTREREESGRGDLFFVYYESRK